MIQLYKKNNANFDMNGDISLHPISCFFRCAINGRWSVELINPIDKFSDLLTEEAVLKVPTPYGLQLFRICDYSKNEQQITVTAYPIFFDVKNEMLIFDSRPTNCNGQDALNKIFAGQDKYGGFSNITDTATAYWEQTNPLECINGDMDNSFLNRWGGEIYYNNYNIYINKTIGSDNGSRAEFGFNLTGIEEKIDTSEIVTVIYPKAFNGYMLPEDESIDSKYINHYAKKYKKIIEYSNIKLNKDASDSDEENGIILCENLEELHDELRKQAKLEYDVNKIDIPKINYEVNMIDLSKMDIYKNYKNLLNVSLGDTVHIKHRRLNIETAARVIELEYNCILQQVENLILGNYITNFFDETSSVVESVGNVIDTQNNSVMAEKIAGVLNLMKTSLKAQKDIAKKQDVRAILFEDLDKESPTFGAMCLGTKGLEIAGKRNETDTGWVWGTAIDFQAIYADYIVTGILSDKKGNNFWDLDKGELVTKKLKATGAEITGTIKGSQIEGTNVSGGTITGANINGGRISVNTSLSVGNTIYLNPGGGGTFGIYMNNNSILRLVGATTMLDGNDIQLFAGQGIHLFARRVTSDVPITVTSDARFKENIENINLEKIIDAVKVKKFDYIKGKKNVIGVIAQDLKNTEFYDLVTEENKDGYLSVDYNALAMACIQKVQKIDKELKKMRKKNDNSNKE